MRNIYQFLLKSKRYGDFKTCLFYQRPSWILKKRILPSLSQSAWNTRFYFGHQKPCMDNNKYYLYFERKIDNLIVTIKH